jgi:hypothetical protein
MILITPHYTDDSYYLYDIAYSRGFENYSRTALPFDVYCVAVAYEDDKPIAVSSAYERDMFNDMCRVQNRYYCNLKYSNLKGFGKGIRPFAVDMIDKQINYTKKYGFDSWFFSMERSATAMSSLIGSINNQSRFHWNFNGKNYRVATGSKGIQQILWTGKLALDEA